MFKILFTSLYHINILSIIKKTKKHIWIVHSTLQFIAFFQNNFNIVEFITININLHQSKAGIGKRLKTHKFILIIAHIIIKNTTQAFREFDIKSTIHIGPAKLSIASCLSLGFSGLNIFFISIPNALNTSSDWLYVLKLSF